MRYRVEAEQLRDTFAELRSCGAGQRECQVIWTSRWSEPKVITRVIHPAHSATHVSFDLDNAWLTRFWKELTEFDEGARVQVHTHPGAAFHSGTDDTWPLIHTAGFLSLVIPRFAMGPIDFTGVHVAELGEDGEWREVDVASRIELVQ